ncbi:MAG TPA: glycosyltransferase [Solirubrobacteraceae bacterium]|jgi:glycosyltransferase involved in cell wall biosynthesis
MHILVTVPWGERLGGAESMLQGILDGAAGAGHRMDLVFFEDGRWPQELAAAGLDVEVIRAGRLRDVHRWIATVIRLARVFRRRRPDLILNWSPKTQLYGSPAAVLAGMRSRVIWWQHGIPAPAHWMDRLASLLPAVAVGCSSHVAARAQARLFPSRRTFVVAPGAPSPQPGSEEVLPALPTDVPIVGIVGRLQPWKGQHKLLESQALLRRRGQELHLVIVGGDAYGLSTDYAESLPSLIGELGLSEAVTMTGQVPDAGPYIERMDVLVNASADEPFGIVLLEGMARGVAVVAVDSAGPAEIIEDRRTGLLARSGEPEDLAEPLGALLGSAELREGIARAGRERFLAEFTNAAMQRRFFERLAAVRAGKTAADTMGAQ